MTTETVITKKIIKKQTKTDQKPLILCFLCFKIWTVCFSLQMLRWNDDFVAQLTDITCSL